MAPIKEFITAVEAQLVRKIDWRILPFISLLYLLSYLDRSNISNVHDDLTKDLDISESQYSLAVAVFYIGYIIFEIPSNLILKRVSPALWIGTIVIAWGICSTAMVFVNNYASLIAVRVFLGIAEAGFFPGIIFYLTFWYRRQEQGLRFALFYCSSALAGAFGGLMAYGILQMENVGPFKGWQWLFLFEGIPSIVLGVVTWFYLPTYPAEVKWLSVSERELAVGRLSHLKANADHKKISGHAFKGALKSPKVWGFMLMFFCTVTPAYAVSFFLPAILGEFYDTLTSNLLTSPVWFFAAFFILFNAWHSDLTGERAWHVIVPALVGCVAFIGVAVATSPWLYNFPMAYICMFFVAGSVTSLIPIIMAWLTNMIKGQTKIATATAMVVGFGNLGGIVGPNLYGFLYIEGEPTPSGSGSESSGTYYLAHFANAAILFCCAIVAFTVMTYAKDDEEDADVEQSPDLIVNRAPLIESPPSYSATEKTPLIST